MKDPWDKNYVEPLQLTLRDYFAAKAMNGILAGPSGHAILNDRNRGEAVLRATAGLAYEIADFMVEARK